MLTGPSLIPSAVKKAVIFCHGYGANGSDLLDIARVLAPHFPQTAFFCPDAPRQLAFGGFQWFSLEDYKAAALSEAFLEKLTQRAQDPARQVRELSASVRKKYGLKPADMVFAGFSQGGLVALCAGLTASEAIAGIVGMSAVPPLFSAGSVKHAPPVLLTHGTDDDMVPPAAMDFAKKALRQAGVPVQTVSLRGMGHGIDDRCVAAVKNFLQTVWNLSSQSS